MFYWYFSQSHSSASVKHAMHCLIVPRTWSRFGQHLPGLWCHVPCHVYAVPHPSQHEAD